MQSYFFVGLFHKCVPARNTIIYSMLVIKKLQCNVHLALVFLLYHAVIFTFLKAFFVYELLFRYNKNRLKIFHRESLENWKQGFKTKKEMKSWSVFSKKKHNAKNRIFNGYGKALFWQRWFLRSYFGYWARGMGWVLTVSCWWWVAFKQFGDML